MAEQQTSLFSQVICPDDAVEMGRIIGAWGVKGWVKLLPYSQDSQALAQSQQWFLKPPILAARAKSFDLFSQTVQIEVLQLQTHKDIWVAHLKGVNNRDVAEALKGVGVFLSRADFPSLESNEFYWVDLLGYQVINRQGVVLGVLDHFIDTGPHSVMVVKPPSQELTEKERLIPFVEVYVDQVDAAHRQIEVDWPLDYLI